MTRHLNGWTLTGVFSVLLLIMVIGLAASEQFSTDGARLVIRATARTSLLLFLPVFAASALVQLWPTDTARWLRRNRRYLGVSFAVSHAIHGIAIIVFAQLDPAQFAQMTSAGTLASGGLAYLFILLMTATSFDRSARWLGARHWRILHWCGAWYIALSFIVTNAKRTPEMPLYWLPVALMAVAILLRLIVWWRGRTARVSAPA